ncbi:Rrf2 family transcriptional regulator [Mucilaginibacter sp. PAMB04274]|uniref:RrF2 family transcriptional regulator n=1 Tax=Mucilaginibacter sp. PAMB04274 TaxID=3138568 RepID=UPI0031F5FA70
MNGRFQIAVHILTLLHSAGDAMLSSEYIAGSVNVNPVLIRKELSTLRNAGLVASKEGKNGGYSLGKPANAISMADVYEAVQQAQVLGKARNIPNPKCPVGRQISAHLNHLDNSLSELLVKQLNKTSLEEFYRNFK